MKIHSLELTGVGAFKDRQVIDFDPLSEAGLFLIDGPTGVGKSTIIDAIVYALFGVVSGSADLDRIRSNFCTEDDPTGVRCTFSVDGRRHVVSRVPRGARDPDEPNKKAKSAAARQVLREYAADGTEVRSMVRDDEIRQHIESLLRMNADQFRRLVVLPQGKFAELLVMKPRERLDALGSLLGEEFYARLQDELQAEGDRAKVKREAATAAVRDACQRLVGRLTGHRGTDEGDDVTDEQAADHDFTDEQVADADRLASVQGLLDQLGRRAAGAQAEQQQAQQVAAATDATAQAAEQLVRVLHGVGAAQGAVTRARSALAEVDADLGDGAVGTLVGELMRRAGALESHAAWESQAQSRAASRARKASAHDSCIQAKADLEAEQGQFPQALAELTARRDAATVTAAGLGPAQADRERLTDLLAKAKQVDQLAPKHGRALADLAGSQAAEQAAVADLETATKAWHGRVQAQLEQQAAHLATQLVDGSACPVCGSPEHPDPARPDDGTLIVTDADISDAQAHMDDARRAQQQAQQQLTTAQDAVRSIEDQLAALRGALGETSSAELAEDLAAAEVRVQQAQQAGDLLTHLGQELADLSTREQAIAEQVTALTAEAAGLASELKVLDEAEQQRQAQISELIGEAPSATELLEDIQARIVALQSLGDALAALSQAAAAVPSEARTLPLGQAQQQAWQARTDADAAELARARAAEVAVDLASVVQQATPLAQAFQEALADRAEVRQRTEEAVFLAELATARSPANTRGLQLRSYALQRRFEAVLDASTHHLHRMSSGRFSMELNPDRAGAGHSGLGIWVFDSWSGTKQDPKALSGGETFYAALSLALGLAEVIRSETGGSALETLFVDEGFGSLDQDTLYRVLEQLDQLRAGGRAVGVVSHVTEMKEQISERIEVRRQADNTSVITVPGNR